MVLFPILLCIRPPRLAQRVFVRLGRLPPGHVSRNRLRHPILLGAAYAVHGPFLDWTATFQTRVLAWVGAGCLGEEDEQKLG